MSVGAFYEKKPIIIHDVDITVSSDAHFLWVVMPVSPSTYEKYLKINNINNKCEKDALLLNP